MRSSRSQPGPWSLTIAGAAAGALALALLGLGDVVLRPAGAPPLATPFRDLGRMTLAGAAVGCALGALRNLPLLRGLHPFGLVLGSGIALRVWLALVAAGAGLLGQRAVAEAGRGVAILAAGLVAGQLLGVLSRRIIVLGAIRPRPGRDLVLALLLLVPAALPSPRGAGSTDRPNVLVITIDTLRADRLGLAGHPRPTSPSLDRLARPSSVRFRGVTPQPRTLPGLASLFTGQVPPRHGVRDNFHYALGPDAVTLAERLAAAGWVTGAVNSNPVLAHDSGIYQGFASASDRGDDWARLPLVRGVAHLATLVAMRRGDREMLVTELALDWLRGRSRRGPFFLWVHYLAPHMPYEPVPPFDRLFDPDYDGPYRGSIDYREISKGDMTYRNPLPPRTIEHVKALYDGEVATSDRAIGRLLEEMELCGDLDRTLVVVTADHGESLDEHGYFFNHGDFVYGPAANVPLIWRQPGHSPSVLPGAPGLIDLYALVLEAAGLEPGAGVDGRWPPDPARPLFGESDFCRFPDLNDRLGWLLPPQIAQDPDRIPDWKERWEAQANRAKQRFVERDGWKLVLTPRPDGDRRELFDLAADPAESRDVSAQHPEMTAKLSALLAAWMRDAETHPGTATERVIDDALREQLGGLGYLGR